MSEVGGYCHIDSQPGTGTKVELLANLKYNPRKVL